MGLVEVAENTVGMLELMAEEVVGEGFEGVLGIGGVFVVKCGPVNGMFVGSWVGASFGWCDKGIVA